jgi:hypothetical protein
MTAFLIIINLQGGIAHIPMSESACTNAQLKFNEMMSTAPKYVTAVAFCIKGGDDKDPLGIRPK